MNHVNRYLVRLAGFCLFVKSNQNDDSANRMHTCTYVHIAADLFCSFFLSAVI